MRMKEGDQYRHPHGHQQNITDGDGPPQDQTSEAGLHLLRNLIGLVILCHLLHVKQISLMSEGGHHLVTGIEETGEDHLERRDSENLHTQMINGEDRPHPTGTTQIIYPLTTL